MAFIFDMDGVIVDNHEWHLKAFIEFGKKYNKKITREGFGKYFGCTNSVIMKSLFGETISEAEIKAFADEKEDIYRNLYKPFIRPVDGLPAFLEFASSNGIPVGLATSAPEQNVEFTLEYTGLKKYFNAITDSSMVTLGKPDPQVYLVTAGKLGVHPSECIVFEDSVPGIMAAKNAGMHVIGVATTHKSEELLMHVNEIIMNFEAAEKSIGKWLHFTESK